jgi:hypothetical protein
MKSKSKLSRKFILSHLAIGVSIGLPILYKYLGIADAITMSVLGVVSFSAFGYGVNNILAKKTDIND